MQEIACLARRTRGRSYEGQKTYYLRRAKVLRNTTRISLLQHY